MKFFFSKESSIILAAFCLFVFGFHKYKTTEIQQAIEEHARVIAASIWDLNVKGSEEYLLAVAMHYNYEHIAVRDTGNTLFIEVNHPKFNVLESKLISLKLIPRVSLSADIFYDEELLGKVEVLWLNTSIIIYVYAFIIYLLLLAVVYLYNRVLAAKLTLEKKVESRTKELFERSRDLQESERRFRNLVDQATDAIFVADFDGRIIDTNRKALETLGYTQEEILQLRLTDVDTGFANEDHRGNVWENLAPNKHIILESKQLRKDGTTFPVEINIGQIEVEGQPAILGIARDITKRKKEEEQRLHLEAKLVQAQKMEAIGTLAGGIAHDLNNILSPIYGYSQLALQGQPSESELKTYLNEIFKAAHRAKELVKQILTFSRLESQQQSPVEVHIIVKEALKLLRASIPTTIEIRQDINPHCGCILANPTQIHQILMNLCTNAYHAMREQGGILSVSLTPLTMTPDDAVPGIALQPGPYLRLAVSDTGHGMDRKTLDRIFEPYFTTKAKDEGTGLGLSIVHGIVKGHGGHITVYSKPGEGSTFHVYWPVAEQPVSSDATMSAEPLPSGNEKIILIDDDETTLRVEETMLKSLGYNVHSFTVPMEALEFFQETPDMFDLVVTDMTMPGMIGLKLFQEVTAIRPNMPVILCTGFSEIISEDKAGKLGIKALVMKPIMITDFAKLLREVLDEAGKN